MGDILTFLKLMLDARNGSDGLRHGGMDALECRQKMQKAMQNPKVKFMIEQLEKSGCPINPHKFIKAVRCPRRFGAAYIPGKEIVLCCNYLKFQDEVTQAITHELIHAYDDCRAKNLNWDDCYHRACSEIRANLLSGECHYVREYFRGHHNLRGHEPECVRRRATISVSALPRCTKYMTKLALDSVWDICYNDTKPFDKAP